MSSEPPLCKILKRAPWQDDYTRVASTLEQWTWHEEELTPMSELSESIAEEIREEIENEVTQPGWTFGRDEGNDR